MWLICIIDYIVALGATGQTCFQVARTFGAQSSETSYEIVQSTLCPTHTVYNNIVRSMCPHMKNYWNRCFDIGLSELCQYLLLHCYKNALFIRFLILSHSQEASYISSCLVLTHKSTISPPAAPPIMIGSIGVEFV